MTRKFTTQVLHSDRSANIEHFAVHKPVHTSTTYGYPDANHLARVFQGAESGFVYSRQSNPTTAALENKITTMEDGLATACFSTGMAAIGSTFIALLRAGDHIVSTSYLFGNTNSLMSTIDTLGCHVSLVDATHVTHIEAALQENTRLVFVETIANPRTQVADLAKIGELCRERGLLYVVDNTLTSPYLFQPKAVGASLSINSLTKYICGHGNALGGAVTDTGLYDWSQYPNIYDTYKKFEPSLWGITQIRKKGLRDFGSTLTAESAHKIAIGAETLALRMERACDNAVILANFFAAHPSISKVYYPGLQDHPQHELSRTLFKRHGAIISIELADECDCFEFLNQLKLVILSSHLGDNRTLAIPVAHTIYWEMGAERRAEMGIDDSLIRLSIGIEDQQDLLDDFTQALAIFSHNE